MALVYVNGELVPEDAARISVFDHGLVVGDGVFETILLRKGEPFTLTRHLARLNRSAEGLGIGSLDLDQIRRAIADVVASAEFAYGRIRVTVTDGIGPLGSGRNDGPPSVVVAVAPLVEEEHASIVAVVPWRRNEQGALTGLKTTSYGENARALAYAAARGADEALFANTAGKCCEGTGSNIFVVLDGVLCTPPLSSGCLAGVTRALVLERFGAQEVDIEMSALESEAVSEAFLTSTTRNVQPIERIDDRRFASSPGALTEKAMALFATLLEEIDP